ncbi:diguanylate cyclase [Polymorphobacter sp.]|uniref:diguanylate cyclase n=1 Tax=Polymorphobacter sp. TaxID=1909290 RepID=UPI003F6FBACB
MLQCFAISTPDGLALLPVFTVFGLLAVGIANWTQGPFFGKRYFLLAHVAMIVWVGAVAMELMVPSVACKLFWAQMAWPGMALLPGAWAFFIYKYALSIPRVPRIAEILLLVVLPVIITILAATNDIHGQFYTSLTPLRTEHGMLYLQYGHGPLFYASWATLYLLIGASFALLVWAVFRVQPQYRLHFIYPALMMLLLAVPNTAYVLFGFNLLGFDLSPLFFALLVVLFSLMIATNRIFDMVSIASDLIFTNLRNPALMLDSQGRITAANPVARALIPELDGAQNQPVTDIVALAPALMQVDGLITTIPGRRVLVAGRYYDIDAIAIERPLSRTNEPLGTVMLFNDVTVEEQRYRELEEELASNMRQLETSTAMQAALREAAEFDPLTRVRNRLSLPQLFGHCIDSAAREQRRVVLALFDIDHFKRWNDRHGHAAGDRVLRDFARFLEDQSHTSEPVFRIGGEEFLVMFPDAGIEAAGARVNAMRAALQAAGFQRQTDSQPLTFSAGLAQWPEDGATLEAVLETADRRLYAAKAAGRNRVIAA